MAKRKRIGDITGSLTTDVVVIAAVGVGILALSPGLIAKLKNALANLNPLAPGNLLGPAAPDPTVISEQNLGTNNPFSYTFQPFVDFYNNNLPTIQASSGGGSVWDGLLSDLGMSSGDGTNSVQNTSPTIQQFFVALAASPPTSSPWGLLDAVALSAMAVNIYNAMTPSFLDNINPLSSANQTTLLSSVTGFQNQLQVAFVANYLWWNYNQDMLTLMQGSSTKWGLTPANLDALITQVNSLPVNPS